MRGKRTCVALLAGSMLFGCAGAKTTGAVTLRSEQIDRAGSPITVDLSYEAKGERRVDITLRFVNTGIQDTDRLVANVQVKGGFDIHSGSTRWQGFVHPRQPESYTVRLVVAEGFDRASAEVTVMRSADSKVLLREPLEFAVKADGQVGAVQ
jgi:hypothetical protein